jgi:LPXTG-site transpeptidase (sortase) family protein
LTTNPVPSFPRHGTGSTGGAGPFVRWLGPALAAAGLALISAWAACQALALWTQRQAADSWSNRVALLPPSPALTRPVDGVDFRIRIPRLHYSALVREGVSAAVLFAGPGHYPGTAWPGQPGNVAIAAHDVYWLDLDRLRPGDLIHLDTRYGTFAYRVTGSRVVPASDRTVLAPRPGRDLTLTTCWWFWAGQFAPDRLVVFATSVGPPATVADRRPSPLSRQRFGRKRWQRR